MTSAILKTAEFEVGARRHGATVVTVNRADFELLARAVRITVILA